MDGVNVEEGEEENNGGGESEVNWVNSGCRADA